MCYLQTPEFLAAKRHLLTIATFSDAMREALRICLTIPMWQDEQGNLRSGQNRASTIEVDASVDLALSASATEVLAKHLEAGASLSLDGYIFSPTNTTISSLDPYEGGTSKYYRLLTKIVVLA
jgi:hypothetical protein